ncbi:HlyD family efflux transporter periplasmic adaptor subunit [Nisaea sp.]|uniref:HlyD family efflux transporter periplasmic adaptor subunit n=1 Tax=Nisaea sp. TaxID=2024842 RepID=UPI0032EACB69
MGRYRKTGNRVGRLTHAAPVAGEVTGLSVHTLGGTVQPGAPLMQIVPDGDRLTGERRVLEYVLQPVLRYASEGMWER